MKRRCHAAEVTRPGVDGGRLSDRCWVPSLLTEVEYAESVGDEVQASEEEVLGRLEDGWNSSDPKRVISLEPSMAKVVEKCHPMTKKYERTAASPQMAPTVGAEVANM